MFYMNTWYPVIMGEGYSKVLECLPLESSGGLCMSWAPHHTAADIPKCRNALKKTLGFLRELPMTYQWPRGTWLQSWSSEGTDTFDRNQVGILSLAVLQLNCLLQFPHNKSSRPTVSPFLWEELRKRLPYNSLPFIISHVATQSNDEKGSYNVWYAKGPSGGS